MNFLLNSVKKVQEGDVKNIINSRLKKFESFDLREEKEWFSEMCFCLLTANSKAETAINIQREIGSDGFLKFSQEQIKEIIRKNKHRFHNNKSKYIVEARKFSNIKEIIKYKEEFEARNWLAENIKGLGYKEASHFMRNVGYKNLAILDRHILRLMLENGYIEEIPKSLNKNKYFEIEKKFNKIARDLKLSSAELDMYMWYLKTGKILK